MNKLFQEVFENIEEVVKQSSPLGNTLWLLVLQEHPADMADFLEEIGPKYAQQLFMKLPKQVKIEAFQELSDSTKVLLLALMSDHDRADALHVLSPDELADLFDFFSDEELKKNMNLLARRVREQVLSLLKFDPESAGGVMATDVITLIEDFNVEQSIKLLQRLSPSKDIHQQIYVTDKAHRLLGHINLEDLVLHKPSERIGEFMHKNDMVVRADEDQESVAKRMVHYGSLTAPIVDEDNYFLGVIPSEKLIDVIVEEASEDVQKMAALAPMKYPYFETSLIRLFYQRGYILVALLFAESFSMPILRSYEATLAAAPLLMFFIPMLISAGGNTSSQTSAMVIQGMASGEIGSFNMWRFLKRELVVSLMLAILLGITSFVRVFSTSKSIIESAVISFSLALIVMLSAILGSSIPFALKRLNIDPAFSAGPFLATLMDILGILIYCYISS